MNYLMKPVEDTQESLIQDFSLPVLGILVNAVVSDPTGMTAAVIPIIVREVLRRVINPFTTRGESKRLYQWAKQSAEGMVQRLRDGEKLRGNGFFEETPTKRSNFEEVVESTLKKVMDLTEEPKISFLANVTINIHFDEDLDMNTYRQILKVLNELSYRQLCIIKMCKNADNIDVESLGNTKATTKLGSILRDFFELRDKGFIDPNSPIMGKIDKLYVGSYGNTIVDGGHSPELPGFANQDGFFNFLIETLFKLAELDKIPDKDVDAIEQALKN